MRVLHTADWHLGKKLGRFERYAEMGQFVNWLVEICEQRSVDLVLIAGDLFDTPSPPNRAVSLATEALQRLTGLGAQVVAIAGNHDSADYFENLNRFSELHGVHLVGRPRGPQQGGILRVQTRSGPAAVACCPYLREHAVVDFFAESGERHGAYKQRLGAVMSALDRGLADYPDCVRLLMGHLATDGAVLSLSGSGSEPRGERTLTIGNAYVVSGQQLPQVAQYTALGHIHAAQRVPAPGLARYAGSPLALDFGERKDRKQVVLIDVAPDRSAAVEPIDVPPGRRLRSVSGNWDELVARREEFGGDYLSLTVTGADAPRALLQRAAETFPRLVRAHPVAAGGQSQEPGQRIDRDWTEIYAEYVRSSVGGEPPQPLLEEFGRVYATVTNASD
ncbi:MAG: exonuclease SbcCD subunit D [Chloroflexi bacterium]|nr:exonuclease SbcCD subunit D [Chloroflexota bacterium]